MSQLLHGLRVAARRLHKGPGFIAVARISFAPAGVAEGVEPVHALRYE